MQQILPNQPLRFLCPNAFVSQGVKLGPHGNFIALLVDAATRIRSMCCILNKRIRQEKRLRRIKHGDATKNRKEGKSYISSDSIHFLYASSGWCRGCKLLQRCVLVLKTLAPGGIEPAPLPDRAGVLLQCNKLCRCLRSPLYRTVPVI